MIDPSEGAIMSDDLRGKRVIITAAATGIGRVTAESFLAAGAKVHVCDVDEAGLKAFKSAQPAVGITVADVADAA
jgi:NAD(P)-dependent dehydrogenase (short-subunit alcohol dehydrogenase family)